MKKKSKLKHKLNTGILFETARTMNKIRKIIAGKEDKNHCYGDEGDDYRKFRYYDIEREVTDLDFHRKDLLQKYKSKLKGFKEEKEGEETLGAHLRNLIGPYVILYNVISNLEINKDCIKIEDDILQKLFNKAIKDIDDFGQNIEDIIRFSKTNIMEDNYWR